MRFSIGRIGIALGSGVLMAGGITWWTQFGQVAKAEQTAPILVVKEAVAVNEPIAARHLGVENRPLQYIPPGALQSVGQALERRTRAALAPGDIIIEEKLARKGEIPSTILQVPAGKRAMAVGVDEVVGVAGFVQPGSLVDVIGVFQVDNEPFSKVILQNVTVLAVAQQQSLPDQPEAKVTSSVTLAVSPSEAEKLILAAERGKVRLAMRSPHETDQVTTAGSNPSTLAGVPKAKPRPAAARPVERQRPAPRPAP
ncbi:MAG: Flp pilus assembly protein CpaB, partial [Candidatus Sericytochromatia bacterium]|nr:Flp pilus assembly protein CpaB [Candidatus Tanganyikabacteria bacterium]